MNFSYLQIKTILLAGLMLGGATVSQAQTLGEWAKSVYGTSYKVRYKHSKKRVVMADEALLQLYLPGASQRVAEINREFNLKKQRAIRYRLKHPRELDTYQRKVEQAKQDVNEKLDQELSILQQQLTSQTETPTNSDYYIQMYRWVNGAKKEKITYKHFEDLLNQTNPNAFEGHERDGLTGHERDGITGHERDGFIDPHEIQTPDAAPAEERKPLIP